MINISDANKALWNSSTEHKTLTITFPDDNVIVTNSDLISESLLLEEAINEESWLTFTGCIASRLEFDIANIVQDLRGHRVTASIKIALEDPVPLFTGYVDTQDNLSHQDVVTHFECYDPMVSRVNDVDVTYWYKHLSFPMTLKAFRDSFFTRLGLTQRDIVLPNDGLLMSGQTIDDEYITGRDIIRYICQLNAVFGQFDREGYFKYKSLMPIQEGIYPSTTLYPATDLYPARESIETDASSIYSRIKYEPFKVDVIDGVNIFGSSGTIEGTYGTGNNALYIADNPLAWAVDMNEAAANIYVQVEGLQFDPAEIAAVGLPYVECGDAIFVNTMKNIVRTYIFSRTLQGIQAIEDEYRCESQKKQHVYRESNETQITRNADGIEDNAEEIEATKQLVVNSIEAEQIRVNKLVADTIEAEQIRVNNLVAGTIEAEQIRVNKLVADSIEAEQIRVNKLVADFIEAEQIRVNKLVADSIETEAIRSNEVVADSIEAEAGRVDDLLAEKASFQWVNSNFADFNYVNSNFATIQTLQSNYATIQSLNAVDGKFANLDASNIKSGTLSAARIDVNTLVTQSTRSYIIQSKGLQIKNGSMNISLIGEYIDITQNGATYHVPTCLVQ